MDKIIDKVILSSNKSSKMIDIYYKIGKQKIKVGYIGTFGMVLYKEIITIEKEIQPECLKYNIYVELR